MGQGKRSRSHRCSCYLSGWVMFKRLSLVVVLLLQFQCITARSQDAATQHSEHRKTSEPYTGDLSIFDSPGRDERLQINRVMDILGIGPVKAVADIGAGSGWFTVRAAKRVGDTGNMYAVDINPEAFRHIESRMRTRTSTRSSRYWASLTTCSCRNKSTLYFC